ncbi:NADH:flavin oxidoreductase/NADH oxidase family protein [Paenibacillus lemnae]|uniref:NADH:flavin oxidoreductase/NADH oxidase family protein n=1 Tax=Paenibacillus lemnae TaxID=1330551 RepID=A0A848M666_PAELE|nr:NADH:flavin oxidoreductase/NADH oxidase family protein [Paenibacillus lemnae]
MFQPLKLPCGVVIKNRFFKSAMSEGMGDDSYGPTQELIHLYKVWGEGGTGLLVTGNVMIDHLALGEPSNVVVEDNRHMDKLKAWAQSVTGTGAHLWVQLNHPGKQSPKFLSKEPVAPSAIPLGGSLSRYFAAPRALTKDEIRELIQGFARSALICKQAGFSGVQIHGAHGYLVSQFLSPHHNRRDDAWGGSLEHRMRFVTEIYKAIRHEVGPEYAVSIKLNSADFQRGGFTEEESLEVIRTLSDLGIDLIEISGGSYEKPAMTGSEVRESTREREAYFLIFAAKVKSVVACPVVVTGGFRSVRAMNGAIIDGESDMIGIARPLAVMPELPVQIQHGHYESMEVPKVTTGSKSLDQKLGLLENVWYSSQLKRIGAGKRPVNQPIGKRQLLKLLMDSGIQILRKKRA